MDAAVQVVVESASMVVPSEETPRGREWVSNLDVAGASRGYVPLVYLYRRLGGAAVPVDVGRLKGALAKALVAFYPLAGRLALDGNGRPEIDCSAEGALFVVARSRLTVDGARKLELTPEMKKLFIPRVVESESLLPGSGTIMLGVQVTLLQCGGVVVGMAIHHIATDAPSIFHFMRVWCSLARDGLAATVDIPCHDRGLLRARSPPVADAGVLSVFVPKIHLCDATGPVAARMLDITRGQVATLKGLCGGGAKTSTFRAVAAHVWRCACAARGLQPDRQARIIFVASFRRQRRLRPQLPEHYFGNAVLMLSTAAAAGDIVSGTLASVSDRIGRSVDRLNDDLARAAVDYLELAEAGRMSPLHGTRYLPETDLRVVSWLGMTTYGADFGWGAPEFMGRAEMPMRGHVILMDGPANDGGVRVMICLELASMELFKKLLYTSMAPCRL